VCVEVSTSAALIALAVPLSAGAASVAHALVRQRTERRRLELVERLAAQHGVTGVSALSEPHSPGTLDKIGINAIEATAASRVMSRPVGRDIT
jgi:hypothetical protein